MQFKKERDSYAEFVKTFSQLQEVHRSIIREDTIHSSPQVRAEGEEGQLGNVKPKFLLDVGDDQFVVDVRSFKQCWSSLGEIISSAYWPSSYEGVAVVCFTPRGTDDILHIASKSPAGHLLSENICHRNLCSC